jgi:hypothetical protein
MTQDKENEIRRLHQEIRELWKAKMASFKKSDSLEGEFLNKSTEYLDAVDQANDLSLNLFIEACNSKEDSSASVMAKHEKLQEDYIIKQKEFINYLKS